MFPKSYQFSLEERTNYFTKTQTEWSLFLSFDGGARWIIKTWQSKPVPKTVEKVKSFAILGVQAYIRSIRFSDMRLKDDSQ